MNKTDARREQTTVWYIGPDKRAALFSRAYSDGAAAHAEAAKHGWPVFACTAYIDATTAREVPADHPVTNRTIENQ